VSGAVDLAASGLELADALSRSLPTG